MEGIYPECKTLWDYFKRTVKRIPNHKFLGTRVTNGKPYEWMTYREAKEMVDQLVEGMH